MIVLIEKNEFAIASLDPKHETFVVQIAALNISFNSGNKMYSLRRAQIAHLKANKAQTKVFSKYTDFEDVFSSKLAAKLLEHMGINNYAIKLVGN